MNIEHQKWNCNKHLNINNGVSEMGSMIVVTHNDWMNHFLIYMRFEVFVEFQKHSEL